MTCAFDQGEGRGVFRWGCGGPVLLLGNRRPNTSGDLHAVAWGAADGRRRKVGLSFFDPDDPRGVQVAKKAA